MRKIIVVGGGPAGAMAAITAAASGSEVHLYEKNEKIGKKLYITGKGRCNVTNNCTPEEFLQAVCVNRKFLYSAGYGFTSRDVMDFFEEAGLRLKTERGNRVFPVSDHSSDVIAALNRRLASCGVKVHLNREVTDILVERGAKIPGCGEQDAGHDLDAANEDRNVQTGTKPVTKEPKVSSGKRAARERGCTGRAAGVRLAGGETVYSDSVIVATGGLSYRSTGSTGDGYRFAREAGHQVTELSPSLVPLEIKEDYPRKLQGLSLRNVAVTIRDGQKELYGGFGEMMFTHFGVTGPLILTASTVIQERLRRHPLTLAINLKPALDAQQLDARLLRELDAAKNRQIKNILGSLYPAKLAPVMLARAGIEPEKPANTVTKEERQRLLELTEFFPLTVTGVRDYNEAVVTRGGVSVKEIRPQTMESRLVKGLYFAGEVLDLDAVTGGYNLQIAWSTGYAAGMGAGSA